MATLLGVGRDVRQLYHEVDHVMMLAACYWQDRSGLHGTRHVEMQESMLQGIWYLAGKQVKVKVGIEDPLLPCPEFPGSSGTPPGSPLRTTAGLTPRQKYKGGRNIRLAPLSPPSSARRGTRRTLIDKSNLEEFFVPDYIIAESPRLLQIYQAKSDCQEIGTINRSSKLFEVVVVLCKLRWLVRLHGALLSFGGKQCSLQRTLLGMLADACNPENLHLAAPTQVFELVVHTLAHRFQESWPLLIRYISGIDVEKYSKSPGISSSRHDVVQKDLDIAASISQIVDDIFVVWLVQAEPSHVAIEAVMQELDYFGIPRPLVRTSLDFLHKWYTEVVANPYMPRKQSNLLAVQEQGHHLAAFLEVPSMRMETNYSKVELIGMARAIVSRPSTFNVGVRKRLTSILQGESRWVGFERLSLALEPTEESLSELFSFTASRLDAGSLNPKRVQKLKMSTPRSATAWLDKRELLQTNWQHSPRSLPFNLSAGLVDAIEKRTQPIETLLRKP